MSLGVPFMCMSTTGVSVEAATSGIPGSDRAAMSLIMSTPSAITAAAVSGSDVSTERGSPASCRLIPRMTGTSRSRWTAEGARSEPGRVDSAPTSIIAAPWDFISRARSTAAAGSRYRPPSEKESGVTLSMPMTAGPFEKEMVPERRTRSRGRRTGSSSRSSSSPSPGRPKGCPAREAAASLSCRGVPKTIAMLVSTDASMQPRATIASAPAASMHCLRMLAAGARSGPALKTVTEALAATRSRQAGSA